MQLIRPKHSTRPRVSRPTVSRRPALALALATAALLSLAAVGCGGDGPTGPGLGSGNVTATGAVTASGTGLALFQSVVSGSTNLFQIVIVPVTQNANAWTVQIANYSGRLAAGTYTLSPLSASSTNPTATFYYTSSGAAQSFNSTSGQLVITSSSSSQVRGTFTFSATDIAGGPGTVSAHGSFSAQCAPGIGCQ
ncbi:MAG TPA: hypothetical protein VK571_02160 [Gemmatimonadaceae bacterium]|nr:hypothetical protein [Gemmatimonadaceae bacterium]